MRRLRDDTGSTLVVVLIIMLVLSIGGLALAAMVTNTTRSLSHSRGTVQSRAAADAGIASAITTARKAGGFCSLNQSGTDPTFTVTASCDPASMQVTFRSVGQGADGSQTTTQVVYSYTSGPLMTGEAELVFFNSSRSVYFTNHVMPQSSTLATILFPGGGLFECKTTVPGNVITKGSFQGQSGCTVQGSLYAGGDNPVSGTWAVYLNNSDQVLGSVATVGNVLMGNSPAKIGGTLTLPSTGRLQVKWQDVSGKPTSNPQINGGQPGGIDWSTTIGQPVLAPWFEYQYASTDFPGYAVVKITNTSSPYTCTSMNAYNTTFWSQFVSGLSTSTVIDASACTNGFQTGSQSAPYNKATVGVNVVLIGRTFTVGNFSIAPKTGTDPQMWWVVPDPNPADGAPTCASPAGGITTNAGINITVRSLMYTPCTITIGAGGTWTGALYAGNLADGGDIQIYTSPMALPGQWGTGDSGSGGDATTSILGTLISQRDVR